MSTDTTQTRDLAAWAETFADFEENLSHWLARTVQPDSAPAEPTEPMPAQMFEKRLERLQAYLDQAEQNAEQALAPLTDEIEAFKQWLFALNTARGNLVERTAGGV